MQGKAEGVEVLQHHVLKGAEPCCVSHHICTAAVQTVLAAHSTAVEVDVCRVDTCRQPDNAGLSKRPSLLE